MRMDQQTQLQTAQLQALINALNNGTFENIVFNDPGQEGLLTQENVSEGIKAYFAQGAA